MDFIDYYELFGISRDTSIEEIKKIYKKTARKIHPDILEKKFKNNEISKEEYLRLTEHFKKLTAAYTVLTDENQRRKYDRQYENHMREEQRRREERQARREQRRQNTYNRQKTYNRQNTYNRQQENKKQTIFDKIKEDYEDIRKDESKIPPFKERHRRIDKNVFKEYYYDDMSMPEFITFQTKRGLIHIYVETLLKLKGLTYIYEDSIPKYLLRNRQIVAFLLAGVVLVSGVGVIKGEQQENTSETIVAEQTIEEEIEKEIEEPTITLYRYYTIQFGDTLSNIAEEAGTSIGRIQNLNDISQPSLIQAGEQIIIPYSIDRDDIKYYSYSVQFDQTISLEEFANQYGTNVDSIIALNKEAIEEEYGIYTVLSDSLNVPNFISKKELQEKQQKQY